MSDSVFEDSIRETFNQGGKQRDEFEQKMETVDKLRQVLEPDEINASVREICNPPKSAAWARA